MKELYIPSKEEFIKGIEELGEVSQALRKGGKQKVEEEVGELFFTLVAFSNKLGIDLENTLKKSIKKYNERDLGEV